MTSGTPNPYRTGGGASSRGLRRRSRARRLLPLGVAVWAVLEFWLLTVIGNATNGLIVFVILLAGFVLGAVVIKIAGRRAWQRLTESLRPPAGREERAGAPEPRRGGNGLTMLGGLLLMLPGLISDAVGLLCIFPPTAELLRRSAGRLLSRGGGPLGAAYREGVSARDRMRMHRPDGKVVRGQVVRDEDRAAGTGEERERGDRGEPGDREDREQD
ncbi:FxsA family membrane protein [Streptomyces hoynatensis]|uniref:FxsA family protein n=1 Tax=Streptomyces hoynatensis TaxID=1141874 RepID=A0A3A9ZBP2_9ACTN|nr:FxsA family membrane protein [Streptomyces hoynatensis]RKN44757.1 FxsA family protein [Streptomyces hoynatensis]